MISNHQPYAMCYPTPSTVQDAQARLTVIAVDIVGHVSVAIFLELQTNYGKPPSRTKIIPAFQYIVMIMKLPMLFREVSSSGSSWNNHRRDGENTYRRWKD